MLQHCSHPGSGGTITNGNPSASQKGKQTHLPPSGHCLLRKCYCFQQSPSNAESSPIFLSSLLTSGNPISSTRFFFFFLQFFTKVKYFFFPLSLAKGVDVQLALGFAYRLGLGWVF